MPYLLALSIGPVQEFIIAARRTRDLWFGSEMLSEVSRAAARAVEGYGKLIFPATGDAANVANVILAELGEGQDPRACAGTARDRAVERWQEYANQAWEIAHRVLHAERWGRQTQDVLEFYAAWAPLAGDYPAARKQAMRLLAGRKACRDFHLGYGEAGVPKSSLDGARESVLVMDLDTADLGEELPRRLRLSPGEQLDAVGVVKRLGGGTRNYPSVSRIAADPWLRGLKETDPAGLEEIIGECRLLHAEKVLTEVNWAHFSVFPFEGSAVYRNRHQELEEESHTKKGRLRELGRMMARLERHGIPSPYMVVLKADGDRMGKAISAIRDAPAHRAFSTVLSRFAKQADEIVRAQHGHLIYSGGDDVLALVALDSALGCARLLHDRFGELMKDWEGPPTLTVGLAIGHFMEPLEDLREWAKKAEEHGKESTERDSLAVHLHTRGGAPLRLRGSWKAPKETRLDRQLDELAEMHLAEQIPDKAGYDLREMAHEYAGWPHKTDEEKSRLAAALGADAARLIERKHAGRPMPGENPLRRMAVAAISARELADLAERVILARHFADGKRQARGKRMDKELQS